MDRQPEIRQMVFEGIAAVKRAQDLEGLSRAAANSFLGLGFSSFGVVKFFAPGGEPAISILAGQFNDPWAARCLANRYAATSPIVREMYIAAQSYSWSEVLRRRAQHGRKRGSTAHTSQCGAGDALFTPMRWVDGGRVAIVLAGSECQLDDPAVRIAAEILSLSYGTEVRRLVPMSSRENHLLSEPQRECLTWVRHGMSSSAISQILGLSTDTVEEHISDACRRLGVRTHVQAVVEACLMGQIE